MGARLRRFLHVAGAVLLYYSGLLSLRRFFRSRILCKKEVCVLGFHRVLSRQECSLSHSFDGIVMQGSTFASLLEYLKYSFSVVSLSALLNADEPGGNASHPLCLLTFDDGWKDNYTTAYPCLKKFGMPATIFLVTGLIGTRDTYWIERLGKAWHDPSMLARLRGELANAADPKFRSATLGEVIEYLKHMQADRRQEILTRLLFVEQGFSPQHDVDQMMNWEQVMEMSRDGIDFGSHTVTHPLLPYETDSTVEHELVAAKAMIEEKLGRPVQAFAYPNGNWDERVRRFVKQAGYSCAFTTQAGWHPIGHDLFALRRILLHEGNVTGWNGKFSPAMFNLTIALGN